MSPLTENKQQFWSLINYLVKIVMINIHQILTINKLKKYVIYF